MATASTKNASIGLAAVVLLLAPTPSRAADNTVSTLGTLHGFMLRNSSYTLRHFVAALEAYRPDVVLNEVRPEHPGAVEGAIDGGPEQAIVYAYAEVRRAQVVPVDWWDDAFVGKALREGDALPPDKKAEVERRNAGYDRDFRTRSIAELNDEKEQRKVRDIYSYYDEVGLPLSRHRNERICKNVRAALSARSGKRVLIVFGLDHKFFLDDCVSRQPGQRLLAAESWLTGVSPAPGPIADDVRQRSIQNLEQTRKVLAARLKAGYYHGPLEKKLAGKVAALGDWISALRADATTR